MYARIVGCNLGTIESSFLVLLCGVTSLYIV